MTWPTATVDHAARARILAAAIPSAAVGTVEIDAPFDEVAMADVLGVAPGTVKSRLHRAGAAFRARWGA